MALTWTDKIDNVDVVVAEDINSIAHEVIHIDGQIGDIESALDNIIVIQNALIGGGA